MTHSGDLNDAQVQAVQHTGSHLLIAAGPGTGKTHTLVRRIARHVPLLNDTQSILAVTFTNKAAVQMQDRLRALAVAPKKVFAGTFHAVCLKLLRDFWSRTSLPKDFRIASEEDVAEFDKAERERIGLLKSTRLVIDPDEGYKAYQRALRQKGLIDFDDILREAVSLLEEDDIAGHVRQVHPFIFVDEYQDINAVQNVLLKLLAGASGAVTAIGDPHQSIYGFRGSAPELFERFGEDFPGARMLRLTDNYRSSVNLLRASTQVISARRREGLELIARMHTEGRLVLHAAASDRAEADYVATQIEKMVGGMDMLSARAAHRSFGDIAVLYRLNAQRHAVGQALEHLGIPFQVSAKPPKAPAYSDENALGQHEEALDYNAEKVSLLTLHAAKGLEFPVVFVIGCEDKLLPLDILEMKGDPDEERRLFYVGMTRARECLYLTYAARRQLYGRTCHHQPSPFLSDIQEELKAYEAARLRKARKPPVEDNQMKLF